MWITVTSIDDKDRYDINTNLIYMIHDPSRSVFFVGSEHPMHLTDISMNKVNVALGRD